jgi:hypothetical protein
MQDENMQDENMKNENASANGRGATKGATI